MIKFRDILNDTQYSNRLRIIVDDSESSWLRSLGKNDYTHSRNIENILDRMIPDNIKSDQAIFDHGEIFLLLASAYLHDIGRKVSDFEHELESYNEIRQNPERYHLNNEFVAEAIAQICAAHAPEEKWPIKKCDKNYGIAGFNSSGRTFDLQKLGSLLRIADELDNSFLRVQNIPNQEESPRNFIRDINPLPEKGVIEIQALPKTWQQWDELNSIRDYCQKRLNEVLDHFEEMGLNYYQIWVTPSEFYNPLNIPEKTNDYFDLTEYVACLAEDHYSKVEILENLADSEISILCTDKRLGIVSKTAIIVRNELSVKDAYEIKGVISHLKKREEINHGLTVVNNLPEQKVFDILSAHGIGILKFNDLVTEFYKFIQGLDRMVAAYESFEIHERGLYVDHTASLENGADVPDLEKYISEWINSKNGVQLTVLGDFGAGKTTLVEKIFYDSAKEFKEDSSKRIPIILRLKTLNTSSSIKESITDLLINGMGLEITYKNFEALNKAGSLLLILDGFDEIQGVSEVNTVLKAFREIDKLVASTNSKVILTCRTHFFKNNVEIHELHKGSALFEAMNDKYGYDLIFVNPFSETQIQAYLERWDSENYLEYSETIKNIYNLSDLASRPALLNIIAKTIPQLEKSDIKKINAASLYDMYIKYWIGRDDWRSPLHFEERSQLSESLTNFMFLNELTTIHYSKINELSDKLIKIKNTNPEYGIDYELRTCNFLRRNHEGHYSFVHKSFSEFILANNIFQQLVSTQKDVSVAWILPIENQVKKVSKLPVVTQETEDFFLQLIETWLRDAQGNNLKALCKNRQRSKNILVLSCIKLQWEDYYNFYMEIMIESSPSIGLDLLSQKILEGQNWENDLNYLGIEIKNTGFNKKYSKIIKHLKTNSESDKLDKVKELECLLKSLEPKVADEIDEIVKPKSSRDKDYPFQRKYFLEFLELETIDLDDAFEIDQKRSELKKEWIKKKAEYDQRQRAIKKNDLKSSQVQASARLKKYKRRTK